jgi:hypothetical protein
MMEEEIMEGIDLASVHAVLSAWQGELLAGCFILLIIVIGGSRGMNDGGLDAYVT